MPWYMWLGGGALVASTAVFMFARPRTISGARTTDMARWLNRVMVLSLGACVLFLLIAWTTPVVIARLARPVAAVGEACWVLLMWLGRCLPDDSDDRDGDRMSRTRRALTTRCCRGRTSIGFAASGNLPVPR